MSAMESGSPRDYLARITGASGAVVDFCLEAERRVKRKFDEIDEIAWHNQNKVLCAMKENRLSDAHFVYSSGYGYDDGGRDVTERIFADVFGAEAALARPQVISGTHALTLAMFGSLRAGDELLAPAGPPYDTLMGVIGVRPARGSLKERGVTYRQVDLKSDGAFDYDGIKKAVTPRVRMAIIQRSKGYSWRRAFSVSEIDGLIAFIKGISPGIICLVDNCYGEFTGFGEPAAADMLVGSLIKNPGGGIAPVGGYIAGKAEYVDNAAACLAPPGLGREVGPSLGLTRSLLQGFFLAPGAVCAAAKGAVLMSAAFEALGYEVEPRPDDARSDIVQAVKLNDKAKLAAFCRAAQEASPVNSFAAPEPWAMPGYDCGVVMASGGFVQGSSIELSADAPVKPPFIVYAQGGLSYAHAKTGVIACVNAVEPGLEP